MKKSVVVAFTLTLEEKDFNSILALASEEGHDFEDAGPIETVRRRLVSSGMEGFEERLGPAALFGSITTHQKFIKDEQAKLK